MADKTNGRESKGFNGFAIRRWSDVVTLAALLSMLVAAIAWGLNLESELNTVRNDLSTVQGQVGEGILPRAEERINALERQNRELKDEIRLLRERVN